MILLTPGPCMTSDSVRQASALPDMNHREPAFLDLIIEVREGLLSVYPQMDAFTPYLIGGSGTAAVEAMATSIVGLGKVLVLENGYYSGRVSEILRIHGIEHESLEFDWLSHWDLGLVEEKLKSESFEAVLSTHHETTTGRLNPIDRLGELCREYDVLNLVDGMSSFGADLIDFSKLDAVCASSNKCLHGIPGVSFVLANDKARARMKSAPRRSFYLSLPMYEGHSPPLTPPVPALAALRQALSEMRPGYAQARHRRYQAQADRIRAKLFESGCGFATPPHEASSALTVATIPAGYDGHSWLEANRSEGFQLYGCKGALADRYFQVSTMGEVTDETVDAWLNVFERLSQRKR